MNLRNLRVARHIIEREQPGNVSTDCRM